LHAAPPASPLLAVVKEDFKVIAAPIPLTSLTDDAAALKRTIERTQGPVVVAGHAYAGAVVGTASDERIREAGRNPRKMLVNN